MQCVGRGGRLEAGVRQHGHAPPLDRPAVEQHEGRHVVLELVEARGDDRARAARQRLADLVVADRGRGVGRRRGRPLAGAAGLVEQHRPARGADAPDGVEEAGTVAPLEALEVHREHARLGVALEVVEVVRHRHVHLVAERDRVARLHDAVEVRDLGHEVGARLADAREAAPCPLAHGQLVLRDEEGVVAAGAGDDPEAVAAVQQHAAVGVAVARSQRRPDARLDLAAVLGLAEAAGDQRDRPGAPLLDDLLHDRLGPLGGDRDDRDVGRGRKLGERRERAAALDLAGPGVDRPDPLARDAAALDQVAQDDPAGVHALGGGADHDRALGQEQPPQLGDRPRRRQGRRPVQPGEAVQRDDPAVLGRDHRVHLELGEAETVGRFETGPADGQPREAQHDLGQPLLRHAVAAARAQPAGEGLVHERGAQGPQRRLGRRAPRPPASRAPRTASAPRAAPPCRARPCPARPPARTSGRGGARPAARGRCRSGSARARRRARRRSAPWARPRARTRSPARRPSARRPARCGRRPRRRRRSCAAGRPRRS